MSALFALDGQYFEFNSARLCLCIRFYMSHESQRSKRPRMRGWLDYTAVVSSAFFCSGRGLTAGFTHAFECCFAAAEGFVVLRRSICSLRHHRHYAESWNFICVCTPHRPHTRNTTPIAREQHSGLCKQQRERRSGGDSSKPSVGFVFFHDMPRKKPFSNKQKKKQLQVKRERKRGKWRCSDSG